MFKLKRGISLAFAAILTITSLFVAALQIGRIDTFANESNNNNQKESDPRASLTENDPILFNPSLERIEGEENSFRLNLKLDSLKKVIIMFYEDEGQEALIKEDKRLVRELAIRLFNDGIDEIMIYTPGLHDQNAKSIAEVDAVLSRSFRPRQEDILFFCNELSYLNSVYSSTNKIVISHEIPSGDNQFYKHLYKSFETFIDKSYEHPVYGTFFKEDASELANQIFCQGGYQAYTKDDSIETIADKIDTSKMKSPSFG